LRDPDRFTGGAAVDAGSGATADADPAAPDADSVPACGDVLADIIVPRCAGGACHDDVGPSAGLDLRSAGIGTRLIDVVSTCNGLPLIDADDRPASYLINKLGATPTCGASMPPGAPLPPDDLACVIEWVEGLQ
jgi:hypothetical protein